MTSLPRFVLLLAAAVAIALPALPASAQQSPSELRRENERLRADVEAMKKELEALREEIAKLRAENANLRKQLATVLQAAPAGTPSKPAPVTVDESRADASPRGLFNAIVRGYNEVTADLFMGNNEDDPARVVYERKVDRWVRRANREFKTPIEWHVRIDDPTDPLPHPLMLRLVAVDPVTDVRLGDPFEVAVTRSLMSRLREMEKRRELGGVLVLRGVLRPMVRFNRNRLDQGPFNNPPFIGPFAEFSFGVDATSLAPPPKHEEDGEEAKKSADADGSPGESRHDR
ncbi:MAG: hypothetical protein ACYTGP_03440 [Planctomycetota bacterium]|jgi:hypothetical protein